MSTCAGGVTWLFLTIYFGPDLFTVTPVHCKPLQLYSLTKQRLYPCPSTGAVQFPCQPAEGAGRLGEAQGRHGQEGHGGHRLEKGPPRAGGGAQV